MARKKYEFTEETMKIGRHVLHRIRALTTIKTIRGEVVSIGQLGGWIESEDNLSHEGCCWVDLDAKVFGRAVVYDGALVTDHAIARDQAKVYDGAIVSGRSEVCDRAWVCGRSVCTDRSRVEKDAWVRGNAKLKDHAVATDLSRVSGYAVLRSRQVAAGKSRFS